MYRRSQHAEGIRTRDQPEAVLAERREIDRAAEEFRRLFRLADENRAGGPLVGIGHDRERDIGHLFREVPQLLRRIPL